MDATINLFERDILRKILFGDNPVLDILRNQCQCIERVDRTFTGIGFYTSLIFKENVKYDLTTDIPNTKADFVIHDLCGNLNENILVGFNAFIKRGKVNSIEGFTFLEENWPPQINTYKLYYCNETGRNIKTLATDWTF